MSGPNKLVHIFATIPINLTDDEKEHLVSESLKKLGWRPPVEQSRVIEVLIYVGTSDEQFSNDDDAIQACVNEGFSIKLVYDYD